MISVLSAYQGSVPCRSRPSPRLAGLPAIQALLIQAGAVVLVLSIHFAWQRGGLPPQPPIAWAVLQGAIAAGLAWRMAARWWLPIHFLFVPGLIAAQRFQLPPTWFLAGFALLWLVHGATYRTQVPLHLSRARVIAAAARLLPGQAGLRVLDLGSGLGGVLRGFAHARPDASYVGIEAAWLPFVVSRLWCRGGAVQVRRTDIWDVDLGRYDVVYAYLSPAAMPRLWAKAQREMRSGSLLISNGFEVPDVPSTMSVAVRGGGVLHVWRMGETR